MYDVPEFASNYLSQGCAQTVNNYYTNIKGDTDLLHVLSLQAKNRGLVYQTFDNIVVCAGAINGFHALCQALCDTGDVILALAPTYILLAHSVEAFGAHMHLVPTERNGDGFAVSPSVLESEIRNLQAQQYRIKAVLVINPTNIDGQYWTHSDIATIAPIIRKHNLLIIEDIVYDQLQYDGEEPPAYFGTHPATKQRCITLDSVSKRYGATQWRIGWVYGPKAIIDHVRESVMQSVWSPAARLQKATAFMIAAGMKMDWHMTENAGRQTQDLIHSAQKHSRDHTAYFRDLLREYKLRRDLCILIINGEGSYNALRQQKTDLTSSDDLRELYKDALAQHGIAFAGIPGVQTPVIPQATMFFLIEATHALITSMPDTTDNADLILARIIYTETGVVMLPPTELTLPEDEWFFRIEFGVELDVLLASLKRVETFLAHWLASSPEQRNAIMQDALAGMNKKNIPESSQAPDIASSWLCETA